MKKNILIIVIFVSLKLIAQPGSTFISQIEALRQQGNYETIIDSLKNIQKKNPNDLWLNYQLACYYSLQKDSINAFHFLNMAINNGADGKDILTDTDFENVYKNTKWLSVVDTLEQIYLSQNIKIANSVLSIELWHIYIEDQRFRTLQNNYKKPFPKKQSNEYLEFNKTQQALRETRIERVRDIIKEYGWPTYTMVGKDAADGVFLVIQHDRTKYIKKYLPYLKSAAFAGEASKENYAKMYDRYLIHSGKKQVFGTQLIRSGSVTKDGKHSVGELQFYPIENFERINERRAEVGLYSFEEEEEKWGVKYNPDSGIELKKINF